MKKIFIYFHLFLLSYFIVTTANSQPYVYVNTENLLLRDTPEDDYSVLLVLHKHCVLTINKYDIDYVNNRKVRSSFYRVSLHYSHDNIEHIIGGWIEKKYVAPKQPSGITDSNNLHLFSIIAELPYSGAHENNPNKANKYDFPYPKYKGGNHSLKKYIRKYFTGKRGGCYYISKTGHKIYVDKTICKDLKKNTRKK